MARDDKPPVEVSIQILRQTEKAYLVTDGTTELTPVTNKERMRTFWLPKSQCQWDPENSPEDDEDMTDPGKVFTVTLPYWIALEKGLI